MAGDPWALPKSNSGEFQKPTRLDTGTPTAARMYDYLLGGKDNFESDRGATQGLLQGAPETVALAQDNRAFLQRVVHYLAAQAGIRQFIDLGSGLPTQDNVHQIAQRTNPAARVVYVDNDPIVLAHGRALLADNDSTTVITADATSTDDILSHPDLRELIDFDQPIGVMFVALLHCIPDSAEPARCVERMLDGVVPGSYLVLSHIVSEDDEAAAYLTDFMNNATQWGRVRKPAEVTPHFDGLELVEPGLVDVRTWRNDSSPEDLDCERKLWELGGVARKR